MHERVAEVLARIDHVAAPATAFRFGTKRNGFTVPFPPGHKRPSPKQIKYAELFLKTGDRHAAYKGAGYSEVGQGVKAWRTVKAVNQVHEGFCVQFIIRSVMRAVLEEMCISANDLARRALQAYENADNVRDQIEALKLITSIARFTED